MRDDGSRRVKESGFQYTVTSTVDNVSDKIFRKIDGTFKSPLYLTTINASPKSQLVRPKLNMNISYVEELRPIFQGIIFHFSL